MDEAYKSQLGSSPATLKPCKNLLDVQGAMRQKASTMKLGTPSNSFVGQKRKQEGAAYVEAPPKKTYQPRSPAQSKAYTPKAGFRNPAG